MIKRKQQKNYKRRELNLLIEFDGTYWHSLPSAISNDKRKNAYIKRYYKHLKLLRIKEKDWDNAKNKKLFISCILPVV